MVSHMSSSIKIPVPTVAFGCAADTFNSQDRYPTLIRTVLPQSRVSYIITILKIISHVHNYAEFMTIHAKNGLLWLIELMHKQGPQVSGADGLVG